MPLGANAFVHLKSDGERSGMAMLLPPAAGVRAHVDTHHPPGAHAPFAPFDAEEVGQGDAEDGR